MTLDDFTAALPAHLARYAKEMYAASICYELDPFVLAAIMERESHAGMLLKPPDPSGFGDEGHGRGLMQIDDRSHQSFLSAMFGINGLLWQEPAFNILYGARLLKMNLKTCGGDYPTAIAGYNCSIARAVHAKINTPPDQLIAALDVLTTGGNYVTDILAHRDQFTAALQNGPTSS